MRTVACSMGLSCLNCHSSADLLCKCYLGENNKNRAYDQSLTAGFDLIVGAGPLREEVMWDVGVVVKEYTVEDVDDPTFAGALIPAMKQACR